VIVRQSWYRDAEVVPAVPGDVALADGEPVSFRPGTLLRTPSDHMWIITGGTRRVFADEQMFALMGYSTKAIRSVSWADIGIVPYGGTV
jgi:hypothetical protein